MTDLLSAEDIKKAIGAFAGEQCTPPTCPCPLALSPRLGHPYPSAKPPPFLPLTHRSPSSGLAPWFSTLQELHCLCALPEPHKVVGSGGWPLWEDSGGSRTKHQDQGGKQALGFWGRTQTSPLRSREGLQTKTFFSKRPLSSTSIPNKIFFWMIAHW